jgi:hypothetical protein
MGTMKINLELIFNLCLALFFYNLIIASVAKSLLLYFFENSKTIQKEKKSFQERIKEVKNESL